MKTSGSVAPFDIRDMWQDEFLGLVKAAQPGVGFSFRYDDKSVGPVLSTEWKHATVGGEAIDSSRSSFMHESGLVVTREIRRRPRFGAVEYKLLLKNAARQTLPVISTLSAVDISFGAPLSDQISVISSGGGLYDGFLPPKTFAIRRSCFAPTVPDAGTVSLRTEGGRSSNEDLPFFFIQNETTQEGLFVAFGWSGQWEAFVTRNIPSGVLRVRGKIPDLEVALESGEEIEGPTVLVGLYKGKLSDGSNRLRRLIRDEVTPKLSGKAVLPVATYDHFWNVEEDFDEALLQKLTDGAAAVGQEYFLLDAGWYAGASKQEGFNSGLGNWQEVDRKKMPGGLGPVADYVRSKGLKFGLWFEPERVANDTHLAREHPEWILWQYGKEPRSSAFLREKYPDHVYFNKSYGLLDFGRPEVQQWVCELLDRYIRDYGVQYIRHDFNIDPLSYWDANDEPGRRGMTQLRHVQGLYSVLDWIRNRHPDTVLEGCASGGRRIDLETARRFHTFWISDYTVDPAIIRFHLFGIHHFLPGNYHYVQYTLPSPRQTNFQPDDLGFQSLFGGSFGTGGRVDQWTEDMKRKARLHVAIWKKLRRYLVEDYYPLSAQPGDLESWSGWQFQDPKDQSGFIQTFRTRTADATHRFPLYRLDAHARYRFTDAYSMESSEMTGLEAMTSGFAVTQEPMSSRVLAYAQILE